MVFDACAPGKGLCLQLCGELGHLLGQVGGLAGVNVKVAEEHRILGRLALHQLAVQHQLVVALADSGLHFHLPIDFLMGGLAGFHQDAGNILAVQIVLGGVAACHGEQGGEHIHGGTGLIDHLACGNMTGPAEDAGNPDAALEEAELMTLEAAGKSTVIGIAAAIHPVPGLPGGAVITLEENDRIIQNIEALQLIYNVTHAIIVEKRFFDYCHPEVQLEMINELVALGISALVIVPLDDPCIRQRLEELSREGILVICLQSEITDFSPFCYIGSDYYVGGRTAAGLLHNFSQSREPRILILNGSPYLSSHRLRRQGFLDELQALDTVFTMVESNDITIDPEHAYHVTKALLREHQDTTAIYTIPDSAAAVGRAIRDLGRIGSITHIGFGMTDSTRPCILDGSLSACIGHRAEQQGALPFSILLDYFTSEKLPEKPRILMLNDIFIKQNSVF